MYPTFNVMSIAVLQLICQIAHSMIILKTVFLTTSLNLSYLDSALILKGSLTVQVNRYTNAEMRSSLLVLSLIYI